MNKLGDLFNKYQDAFIDATDSTGKIIDILVPVRIRLYGRQQDKIAAWNAEHPDNQDNMFFMSVSTNPVELWGDLREADGKPVVNHFALGHELGHAMRVAMSGWTLRSEDDGEMLSPDKYIEI
jgi:hypothetical protein